MGTTIFKKWPLFIYNKLNKLQIKLLWVFTNYNKKLGSIKNKKFLNFSDPLSNRKHYTRINETKSKLVHITCGVPQGTLSGPKLFTILIKGVKCPMVSSYKFVDDKTLAYSYSGDPYEFLQEVLNIKVSETKKYKMVINEAKCN